MASSDEFDLEDHIRGLIYGNAIGDAIGLLTEFMVKSESKKYYGDKKNLEYDQKVPDMHRERWKTGDWTDDTDQMILIMLSILGQEGKVDAIDYAKRLKSWARHGYPELGDLGGMGIGATTTHVLHHEKYETDPHEAAADIWEKSGRFVAPNGALMRTSILGAYQYNSLEDVQKNTLEICKTTHADPRCQASTVAATSAISMILKREPQYLNKDGSYNVDAITKKAYQIATELLPNKSDHKELKHYMNASKLSSLKLDESRKIGYTYKCLGAGFWAYRQVRFREALQQITMEAGDADTNGAIAGALLGCKLGAKNLPPSWLNGLLHKEWLDKIIDRFIPLIIPLYIPKFPDEELTEYTKTESEVKHKEEP